MEVSEVRKRVLEAIERSKRAAAERRTANDDAARQYGHFLEDVAVPLFKQLANVLKAHGYTFAVFTPSGSVRLMSEKSGDDYIELFLDTTGLEPVVMGHSSRARGRRVVEAEQPVAAGPIADLTEDQVLAYVIKELEAFL